MDQHNKDELLRRWRQRMPVHMDTDGLSINTTIAKWVIDIVADARELERGATMAELLSRPGLLESTPYGGPEVYTDERKTVRLPGTIEAIEVTVPIFTGESEPYDPEAAAARILDGLDDLDDGARADVIEQARALVGGPRQHEGFAMTTELTGSIERVSIDITAEYIEGLWPGAGSWVTPWSEQPSRNVGKVGRFDMWRFADGSLWAAVGGTDAVMVVKPEPKP